MSNLLRLIGRMIKRHGENSVRVSDRGFLFGVIGWIPSGEYRSHYPVDDCGSVCDNV